MGNSQDLCKRDQTLRTTLPVKNIQHKEITQLIQSVHKSVNEFIHDNQDFFEDRALNIAGVLLSNDCFQREINKYPIERITQNKRIFFPNLAKEEFTLYEGECLYIDFENIELYIGRVSHGLRQGSGIMINKHGNMFNGYWIGDEQNGQGVFEFMYPKRVYKGQWKKGKLQGQGEVTYEDGAKFEGCFLQGKKHGFGILRFQDGAVYEGSFEEDLMHGFGTLTSPKGRQISGEWKSGKFKPQRPQRSSTAFSINQLPVI